MYDEQPSISLRAKDQMALQFPVPTIFPHANALRAVLLRCGSQRSVSCFFVCFATLIFEFILGGWCFAMSKRYFRAFVMTAESNTLAGIVFLVAHIQDIA